MEYENMEKSELVKILQERDIEISILSNSISRLIKAFRSKVYENEDNSEEEQQ